MLYGCCCDSCNNRDGNKSEENIVLWLMLLSSTNLLMSKKDEFLTAAVNLMQVLLFTEIHFNKATMNTNISSHRPNNSYHHIKCFFFSTQMEASSWSVTWKAATVSTLVVLSQRLQSFVSTKQLMGPHANEPTWTAVSTFSAAVLPGRGGGGIQEIPPGLRYNNSGRELKV